jgi:hypothetical protein
MSMPNRVTAIIGVDCIGRLVDRCSPLCGANGQVRPPHKNRTLMPLRIHKPSPASLENRLEGV